MKEDIAVANALQDLVSELYGMSRTVDRTDGNAPEYERGLRVGLDLARNRVHRHQQVAELRVMSARAEIEEAKARVAELTAATGAE